MVIFAIVLVAIVGFCAGVVATLIVGYYVSTHSVDFLQPESLLHTPGQDQELLAELIAERIVRAQEENLR